jgi:benzoyl-CoA reductase/2-hydroxyglutaryl-CoA dehydratase subunit BcrC/BadD/HgdB
MIELLKLCGYEEAEIERELPRVEKAFQKSGVTPGDIERGKHRLRKYYDMELQGVRKVFRLCLREFVDSLLARQEGKKRLVYGFMAPRFEIFGSAVLSVSKEVCVTNQCWAFMIVGGCIFDKLVPVFETAEKMWLKAGLAAHCGNIKTLVGLLDSGILPKPDLMITTGCLCDTAPKTFDLLHEFYNIPVCFYETCQDRELREFSGASKRAIELEVRSLRKMVDKIGEITGVEITDDMLQSALEARKKLDMALGRMRNLLVTSDPLPLSPTHEALWAGLNSLTLDSSGLQDAVEAIDTLCEELRARINRGKGVVAKGSPRILGICPGHQTDPRLEHLVTELGIAMVAIDSIFSLPYEEEPQGPYIKMALPLNSIRCLIPSRKVPLLVEGCRKLKIDGVLDRYHSGCRTVAGDALLISGALEKELGIPVLVLEWENFDPRYFNYDQYRQQLEAFKEMMVNR